MQQLTGLFSIALITQNNHFEIIAFNSTSPHWHHLHKIPNNYLPPLHEINPYTQLFLLLGEYDFDLRKFTVNSHFKSVAYPACDSVKGYWKYKKQIDGVYSRVLIYLLGEPFRNTQ